MISLEREKLLSELEQKIGHSFRSRALLDRALTHRSFANERTDENCRHNEALEFLGDSVLGLVVSAWLLERYPELSEGKLSKMKAFLVSEPSLVETAGSLDLGRYILLNRGEEKTGGRRKRTLLADAYEALIAVIYIEGGLNAAERFLRRELREKMLSIDPRSMIGGDYKSALQERMQAAGAPVPDYQVVEMTGPDHRRIFRVELRAAGHSLSTGEGRSIKLAQQEAARIALDAPGLLDNIIATQAETPGTETNDDHHPSADFEDQPSPDSDGDMLVCGTDASDEEFSPDPEDEAEARGVVANDF
ncbi:MAG: ribonuclease III [Blastocatellia bacterium]|nr:ribonuclease III [Blastocatellia bacterium]